MRRRVFLNKLLSVFISSSLPLRWSEAEVKETGNKTGFIADPVFLNHHISDDHPETPVRVQYIEEGIIPQYLGFFEEVVHLLNDHWKKISVSFCFRFDKL